MTRDYYAEARDIAMLLEQAGLASDAASLVDAIEGGATATEILMALRWQLDRIEKLAAVTDAEIRRRLVDLGQAISTALGR